MVHIVKNWETIAEYAENVRQGFYIVKPALDGMVEIKVVAGRLGYEHSFKEEDACYRLIKEFLVVHDFTEIETSVDADIFLR